MPAGRVRRSTSLQWTQAVDAGRCGCQARYSIFLKIRCAGLDRAADNAALVTLPEVQAISPWGAVVHCSLVLAAAVVVTLLWGPGTLARFRFEN